MDKNEIIEKLNDCAESYAKTLTKDIPQVIKQIKAYYQLDDDDLCDIFGFNISDFLDLIDDTVYELHDLAMLTLLSNGKFNLFNEAPNGEELNEINQFMKAYHDTVHPEPEPEPEVYELKENEIVKLLQSLPKEKIAQILALLGVNDEKTLDTLLESLKDVNKLINDFDLEPTNKCTCGNDKVCTKDNKADKHVYCDAHGNFHEQKSFKSEDNDSMKIKGAYYDSETMDEPKTFEKELPNVKDLFTAFMKMLN